MIAHELFVGAEDACWLHGTTALRTKDALDHDAATHVESPAIVADPIIVGNFIDSIAPLVNWNVASSTEDDEIFVLIITVVTDGALGVFLHYKAALVCTQRVVSLNIEAVGPCTIRIISPLS